MTLVAGAYGSSPPSVNSSLKNFEIRLVPAHKIVKSSFASLVAPSLNRTVSNLLPAIDIVHIHMARDFTTAPLAWLLAHRKIQYVIQTHGMILDPRKRLTVRAFDTILTRSALSGSQMIWCLSEDERLFVDQLVRGAVPVNLLPNGVDVETDEEAFPEKPEVLFLARLAPRKRPVDFVRAAAIVHGRGISATFTLCGPDGGEKQRVQKAISSIGSCDIGLESPLSPDKVQTRMRRASIYVLPATNEPFGLTVIEAMAAARPVIVSRDCALAQDIEKHHCGIASDPNPDDLADSIAWLLSRPQPELAEMGRRGRQLALEKYNWGQVLDTVELAYGAYARRP